MKLEVTKAEALLILQLRSLHPEDREAIRLLIEHAEEVARTPSQPLPSAPAKILPFRKAATAILALVGLISAGAPSSACHIDPPRVLESAWCP